MGAGTNMSMNTPMHRVKYTNVTKDQIGQKLKAAESAGPTSVSALSDVLSGKAFKVVTNKGLTLDYQFRDKNRLTVSENGGPGIQAGYGALPIRHGVVFSHMIPGAQKGYNVYVDLETDLVTVFEVWFSSGMSIGRDLIVEDREVQREFHFGYIETAGKKPPEELHHLTNRIEGKGIHWKQDTGIETLELYISVASLNFVELTRHTDYLSFCSPSDYVMLNATMFIHSRSEAEFSGIYTMYVLDLFGTPAQAGVRLGFNEKDELEYYMFRGEGEIVGQIAALEPFNVHGRDGMGAPTAKTQEAPEKGRRSVYRPGRDVPSMTDEEVHEAALKRTVAFGGSVDAPPPSMARNPMPSTDKLIGKEFTLRYDRGGPVRHYRFREQYKLSYRDDGETRWHEADCRVFEGDTDLFWFTHFLIDSKPRACVQVAVDFTNGLTTCINSRMGTPYYGNEATYDAFFGVIEMDGINPPKYVRHEYTCDLVGHAFSCSYSDQLTSMQLWPSPHSISWTIFTENQTRGSQWSSPAMMIKLRPMIYMFAQSEEAGTTYQMVGFYNLRIMRIFGVEFIGGARGVNLSLVSGICRHIGKFDLVKFYGPKMRS